MARAPVSQIVRFTAASHLQCRRPDTIGANILDLFRLRRRDETLVQAALEWLHFSLREAPKIRYRAPGGERHAVRLE